MSQSTQKVVQYLAEAHANEMGLLRVLQAQIAITPRGSYRAGLEKHLDETGDHAERVQKRLGELGRGQNPLLTGIGFTESMLNQTLAFWKAPLELLRGSGAEEKVLKNAKDLCTTEALEIATYTALERVAKAVGDDTTARLAASIRSDEEKMLERVLREIPKLADAVVEAEVNGKSSYDVTKTGAADALRDSAEQATQTARQSGAMARETVGQARRVPAAVAQAAAQTRRGGSENGVAIAGYDELTAEGIAAKLPALSQSELAKLDVYERQHDNRATVRNRVDSLRGDEPWRGYDELTAEQVRAELSDADDERANAVRAYERAHKNRTGVLNAVERELANA